MGASAREAGLSGPEEGSAVRRLSIAAFIAILVVDLAILQGVGALGQAGLDGFDDGHFRTSEQVALGLLLPVGLSVVFVYGVVAALGWWRPVFVDDRPVQRWVWVVPIVFAVAVALGIDYAALADKGVGFVMLLLLAAACVGFGEEGMFRGIGVTTFRVNGLSEGKVALWSSVVFGAVHLTNAIATGGTAIVQAIAVSFAGYFFYLTRRVSGGLIVPAVIHGLFDFSILSGAVADDKPYAGGLAAIVAYPLVAAILLARRHRIEPSSATPQAPAPH
jgi:CAAX protease family protein